MDARKYEDEINHIEISHERTRAPKEPLAEADQSILRSELAKLMRIARIARPGAIYDASAAAQTFSDCEIIEFLEKGGEILENEEKISRMRGGGTFRTHGGICRIHEREIEREREVNKSESSQEERNLDTSKRILRCEI